MLCFFIYCMTSHQCPFDSLTWQFFTSRKRVCLWSDQTRGQVCVWVCIHGHLHVWVGVLKNKVHFQTERKQSIKIGLFIEEPTFGIKGTTFTRHFNTRHRASPWGENTDLYKIFWHSSVFSSETLYLPFCELVFFFSITGSQRQAASCALTMIFSGHEVTRLETIQSQ